MAGRGPPTGGDPQAGWPAGQLLNEERARGTVSPTSPLQGDPTGNKASKRKQSFQKEQSLQDEKSQSRNVAGLGPVTHPVCSQEVNGLGGPSLSSSVPGALTFFLCAAARMAVGVL